MIDVSKGLRELLDKLRDTQDKLDAAEAREKVLREAVEPFAISSRIAKDAFSGPADISHLLAIACEYVCWSDFKRARAALAQTGETP